jgi:hypothetical protein
VRPGTIVGLLFLALFGCGSGAAAANLLDTAVVDTGGLDGGPDGTDVGVTDAAGLDVAAPDGVVSDAEADTPVTDTMEQDVDNDTLEDVADVTLGDPCLSSTEEPNETPEGAFVLNAGTTITAALCAVDEDWFAFDVPSSASADIEIRFRHRGGDLELEWYSRTDAAPVAQAVSGNDDELLRIGPARNARRLYARVFGFEGALNDYDIELSLEENPDATWTTVSGQVDYEDQEFGIEGFTGSLVDRPARHVRVEAVDAESEELLGQGATDEDGAFSIDALVPEGAQVIIRAVSVLSLRGFASEVRDRSGGDLYRVPSGALTSLPASDVRLLATQRKVGGAFNILDVTATAFTFVAEHTDERSPTLTYSWERPQAFGCGSCYSSNTISLGGQLEDPDEYDDDIVLHEFGHYFVDHFSADNSPGGSHRDRQVSPALAYGEGLAYFWAAMVFNEAIITDNFLGDYRSIDFEHVTQNGEEREDMFGTEDGTITGDRREEVSGAILWDLYDAASDVEPFDQVALGADAMMDMLLADFDGELSLPDVGARGIDLADALNATYCRFPEIRDALQPIVDARGYPFDVAENADCGSL